MKALVTGGGGFLGRYIAEQLLARGDDVTVFSRGNYPELVQLGAKQIQGDLQHRDTVIKACAGQDAVFHVAAKAGYWGTWESFYQSNVLGTKNIIDACREQGIGKLIFTSTPSVIVNNRSRIGADESLPYPETYESYYPQTKAMAEQMVRQANSDNLLTVSLRPHVIYGPRDAHIIPRLVARARVGKLIQVGDGTNKIDVTYVEDAARSHLLAADALKPGSAVAGSVYFISQDQPVVLWSWVNDLLRRLGVPPVTKKIPLSLARALGGAMEFTYRTFKLKGEPRLTRYLADELGLTHYYDISRAKQDFGYQPQVSMEESLQRTAAYFKQVGL
ncbi:MAG: NAD-dependent epimerase/dehydratase family protein [Anaerolineae bacterium]|nr:NAD-dependent epimerase/dehydratase family protein [Anaerolineae bacterium]